MSKRFVNVLLYSVVVVLLLVIIGLLTYKELNLKSVTTIPTETNNWELVAQLERQEKIYRANNLLSVYFNGEQIIQSYENGPSGSLIIKAQIEGKDREFIMLPDKDHLIEGVMYSPYLTTKNITAAHSDKAKLIAKDNQAMIDQAETLKSNFKTQLDSVSKSQPKTSASSVPQPTVKHTPLNLPENNTVDTKKSLNQFYSNTEELHHIELGDPNAPVLYVYFDFNCAGCRKVKDVLSRFIDSGQIRVRYVPVGVIHRESAIKAAYSLIPASNDDRVVLFNYFNQPKSADELIKKKAPEAEVLRAMEYVSESNKNFFLTPKRLTPTFVFKKNEEVYVSNVTSEKQVSQMISLLNK